LFQSDMLAKQAACHLTMTDQLPQDSIMWTLPSYFQNCHQPFIFASSPD
jgi:hypothetical protein